MEIERKKNLSVKFAAEPWDMLRQAVVMNAQREFRLLYKKKKLGLLKKEQEGQLLFLVSYMTTDKWYATLSENQGKEILELTIDEVDREVERERLTRKPTKKKKRKKLTRRKGR